MIGPRRDGNQSERNFLKSVGLFVIGALTWFVVTTAGELIGNQANATEFGQVLGWYLLVAGIIVIPLAAVVWVVIKFVSPDPDTAEPEPKPEPGLPATPEPPAWRTPDPIFDRDGEVGEVVRTVLDSGIAVVAGARDVGTSAVAEAAVQRLIDDRRTDRRYVVRLDLRSRSTRTPDDARATAGRILSTFGEDEPANGTREVLANAAERLHNVLAKQYAVLMLDNVAVPDEITWLTTQWTERNNRQPWLIIAGEAAIGSVAPDSRVPVGRLSTSGMRQIWYADTGTTPREPARPPANRPRWSLWQWLRELLRLRPAPKPPVPQAAADPLDRLLGACGGRPRAIKAVARETTGREADVESLLESLRSDENNPLVRIWRAILRRAEGSLSDDAVWLLRALSVLPVTALTTEAITALVDARHPDADVSRSDGTPPAEFEELRVRDFVQQVGERYRLPQEIRWALTGQSAEDNVDVARIAVPALIRHHADRVVGMAYRLDVRSVGATAAKWLHDEERSLRPLFSVESYQDDEVLLAAIDDLARIAGALEYWYVREQQADGLLTVSTALGQLAGRAERPGLCALAAARRATAYRMVENWVQAHMALAVVAGEAHTSPVHDLGAELVVRLRVEKALLTMAVREPGSDGAPRAEARRQLEEVARQHGHAGAGIALFNLGAMRLVEDAPDDALTCLRKAEVMARDRNDVGCRAQAMELQGIALSGRDLPEAVSLWRGALQLFAEIGEEQGQARCLQHLGAAALVDPTVAGMLANGRSESLDRKAAAKEALTLLERSKQLRAGQPDTELVDAYLREAANRLVPDADQVPET